MSTTRWLLALSLCAQALSTSGCGDDKKAPESVPAVDAGTGGESDAAVSYQGPVRGGVVPDAPDYEEPPPDDGPFDASVPCCEETLSFRALDDETTLVIEADFAPLDGAAPELESGAFVVTLCMPIGVAIQYRLRTTLETDGGNEEHVRVDPDRPSFEDAEGKQWNLYAQQACEAD